MTAGVAADAGDEVAEQKPPAPPPAKPIEAQDGPQKQFLTSDADIAIIGGGAFGGKSFALMLVDLQYHEHGEYKAVTFRREMTQVRRPGGLWDESCGIFGPFGARPLTGPAEHWFPSGATTKFAHLEHANDIYGWDGAQIPCIKFDQLESFTEQMFWYLVSRNRDPSGKFVPFVRATCNPMPDSWLGRFLAWWIDPDTGYAIPERSGKIRWMLRVGDLIEWADTREELEAKLEGVMRDMGMPPLAADDPQRPRPMSVTFIVSRIWDNPIGMRKDPLYLTKLMQMPRHERERLLGDAKLGGNWKSKPTAGTLFRREWCPTVPEEPENVEWCRGWDLAATKPNSDNPDPDWTVGVKLGRYRGTRRFVIAKVIRLRDNPGKVQEAVENTASADGTAVVVRIPEDPGQAGKSQARDYVIRLAGYVVRPARETGDKVTRFSPFSVQAEHGNVDLVAGLPEAYLQELENFPPDKNKGHDDDADATSTAFSGVSLGATGDQVIDYFKSVGAGITKKRPNGEPGPDKPAGPAAAALPGMASIVDATAAAKQAGLQQSGVPSGGSLKLQTAAHANYCFGANIRYTADETGIITARSEEDALALIKAGCVRTQ